MTLDQRPRQIMPRHSNFHMRRRTNNIPPPNFLESNGAEVIMRFMNQKTIAVAIAALTTLAAASDINTDGKAVLSIFRTVQRPRPHGGDRHGHRARPKCAAAQSRTHTIAAANAASLPHAKLIRAIEAIGTRIAPALHAGTPATA